MAKKEFITTIHMSKIVDPKTLQALGEMIERAEDMLMNKSEFEKFKDMAKTVVNAPKQKKRKPKKKPSKKPKRKGA